MASWNAFARGLALLSVLPATAVSWVGTPDEARVLSFRADAVETRSSLRSSRGSTIRRGARTRW